MPTGNMIENSLTVRGAQGEEDTKYYHTQRKKHWARNKGELGGRADQIPTEPIRPGNQGRLPSPCLSHHFPGQAEHAAARNLSQLTFSLDKWPCQVPAQQDLLPTPSYPSLSTGVKCAHTSRKKSKMNLTKMNIPKGQGLHEVSLWVTAFKPSGPVPATPSPAKQKCPGQICLR